MANAMMIFYVQVLTGKKVQIKIYIRLNRFSRFEIIKNSSSHETETYHTHTAWRVGRELK